MAYGNAVECDACLKIEFASDTLERSREFGYLPIGWLTISGSDGWKPNADSRAIFCSSDCAIKRLSGVMKVEKND